MTQWTRTIGRQITNALPAWYTSIQAANGGTFPTDRFFHIGDLPSASALWTWRSSGQPGTCYTQSYTRVGRSPYGYGGGVWVPTLGAFGSLIYGATGEDVFDEQLGRLPISDANPTWTAYQQPAYCISEVEAAARDADWYYDVDAWNDLTADPARKSYPNMSVWYPLWVAAGKPWPVGHYTGWIWRRPMKHTLGDNTPYAFRYQIADYVPPSMSGLTSGAIATSYKSLCGPFSGGGGVPPGTGTPNVDADFWADCWPSKSRKYYVRYKDIATGAWAQCVNPLPEATGYAGNYSSINCCCVDTVAKRIYYGAYSGSTFGLIHMDCSGGSLASATTGTFSATGGVGEAIGDSSAVLTDGSPAGQRLWFFRQARPGGVYENKIFFIDLATNTSYSPGAIPGMDLIHPTTPSNGFWCFSYDAVANKIHITVRYDDGTAKHCSFVVPANPALASNYAATTVSINTSGVTLETPPWQYGKRSKIIPTLGVIVMTQDNQRALVYKPS